MKKLFTLIIVALWGTNAAFADVSGTTGSCSWHYNSSTKKLTISGSGTMPDYSPYDLDDKPWKGFKADINSVSIDNGVTSIGDYAFAHCQRLTSITIPESVTSIGHGAIGGCSRLTSITIPVSVTIISDAAFQFCFSLTSVTIPNGVTSIGVAAFRYCDGLTSVSIGNSVTSIGTYAFTSCWRLENFVVSPQNTNYSTIDGVLFNKDKTTLISYPMAKEATFYTIPGSVTSIGNYAFEECHGLTSVTIPESVTSIGAAAFWACSDLTSVSIGNSVTSIGAAAFGGCYGLTSVTIPNSVTSIEKVAFGSCVGLTSVSVEWLSPLNVLDSHIFDGIHSDDYDILSDVNTSKITLYVPAGTKALYQSAPVWQDFGAIVEKSGTGIKDVATPDIAIYPNPVSHDLFIKSDIPVEKVEIIDISGRTVETWRAASLQIQNGVVEKIDVSRLNAGIYLVRVSCRDGSAVVKKIVVKQ